LIGAAGGSAIACSKGKELLGDAAGSASWPAWTTGTQPQSVEHGAAPEAGCVEAPQFASWASMGDTQQQNHGVVPQVRPSHCQAAPAWGANAEHSSARSVTIQIVRRCLTGLL
jgi:hypothetical protein